VIAAVAVVGCSATTHRAARSTGTPPPTTSAPPSSGPKTSAPTTSTAAKPAPKRPTPRTTTTHRPPAEHPIRSNLPLRDSTGSARQVITVVAPSTSSTTATVQAWNKSANGWTRVGSAVPAHVGADGLSTQPSETKSATPIGSFTLTQAFGSAANPGTKVPYFRTDASDWWVSDANSDLYNTHYRCSASCPFDTSAGENLLDAGFVYTYALVIDYNRFPVHAGAGSAFFLHVTNGEATAGCVSIPEASLVSIMRWLSPSARPRILIGTS
jgi:L,D-peptidoglycan transpeptidase YkuD (ErfK/YbiS/YcfS/YnhG family)